MFSYKITYHSKLQTEIHIFLHHIANIHRQSVIRLNHRLYGYFNPSLFPFIMLHCIHPMLLSSGLNNRTCYMNSLCHLSYCGSLLYLWSASTYYMCMMSLSTHCSNEDITRWYCSEPHFF